MWGYWAEVIQRANRDTLATLGYGDVRRLPISVAIFLVALFIVRYISGKAQMGDEWKWGISVVIGVIAVYCPIFIYNLLRAPDRIYREQCNRIEKLEDSLNRLRVEVKGNACSIGENGFDLFIAVHNPAGKTVKNVSGALFKFEPALPSGERQAPIEQLIGLPLRPQGKRDPHSPTAQQIDIHPNQTRNFDVARIRFGQTVSQTNIIALSVAEITPALDAKGRTWYNHGINRGIHLPKSGIYEMVIVIRGEDIKPVYTSFRLDANRQTVMEQ